MDNKEQGIDCISQEFDEDNYLNDYESLVQKLKIIKDRIDLLEKTTLDNEI